MTLAPISFQTLLKFRTPYCRFLRVLDPLKPASNGPFPAKERVFRPLSPLNAPAPMCAAPPPADDAGKSSAKHAPRPLRSLASALLLPTSGSPLAAGDLLPSWEAP